MQFNALPSSVLFAKVTVKRSPYANTPIAIRIVADTYETFTANKAQFLVDLPLRTTTAELELALQKLQTKANAAEMRTKVQPPVSVLLKLAE
jgi:hypothetical protein